MQEDDEDTETHAPQPTASTSGTQLKRKRGQRSRNQYPKGTWVVTALSPAGEPMEPPEVRAKFRNAVGALVRDQMDPTIVHWKLVPVGTKDFLWKELKATFIFPRGTEALS